jgi:hypothetical protein
MRSFGTVKPAFWNGPTGRQLRAAGADVQLLALYFLTNPHANMIGLYYLPLVLIRKELSLSMPQIVKGLATLGELRFAVYDADAEMVWVLDMARYQLGESLEQRDHKTKAIQRLYAELSDNCFLGAFHDRYGTAYHLGERRTYSEAPCEGHASPFEGAVLSPVLTVPVPDPSPVPVLKKEEELRDSFESFWRAYPKRKGKDAAWKAWQKRAPSEALASLMVEAVHRQCRDPDWIKDGGKYIPHPATWLNQGRWDDEPVNVPRVTERTVGNVTSLMEFVKDG